MNQENLLNKIRQKDAKAFTHGGKFHADDIFLLTFPPFSAILALG